MASQHDSTLIKRMRRIEELIGGLEASADPVAQQYARELVNLLLELHGAALRSIVAMLRHEEALLDRCAADELTASVLLLHDAHPWPLRRRLEYALAKLRPALERRGGEISIIAVDAERIHIRASDGAGGGCGSTAAQLRTSIENAVRDAAPEVAEIRIDALEEANKADFVTLTVRHAAAAG